MADLVANSSGKRGLAYRGGKRDGDAGQVTWRVTIVTVGGLASALS